MIERRQHGAIAERHTGFGVRRRLQHAHRVDVRVGEKSAFLRQGIAGRKAFSTCLVDAELQGTSVRVDPTTKSLKRIRGDRQHVADGYLREQQQLAGPSVCGNPGNIVEFGQRALVDDDVDAEAGDRSNVLQTIK